MIREIINRIYYWIKHSQEFWAKTSIPSRWIHICIVKEFNNISSIYIDGIRVFPIDDTVAGGWQVK
jgi:hypothetical protein